MANKIQKSDSFWVFFPLPLFHPQLYLVTKNFHSLIYCFQFAGLKVYRFFSTYYGLHPNKPTNKWEIPLTEHCSLLLSVHCASIK